MSLTIKRDGVAAMLKSLHALVSQDVLVGIPATRADRKEKNDQVNNAEIGYWMEFGAPAANIPERPSLIPGVAKAQPEITARFGRAAAAAFSGNTAEVTRQLSAAGLIAQNSVRGLINDGIGPALSDSTLAARTRRGSKGAMAEQARRATGAEPGLDLSKPLVFSGQFRNSFTYVLRKK